MTHKVPLSQVRAIPNFEKAVTDHVIELQKWDAQMANVRKDPKNYEAFPPPVAHPHVDRAVSRRENGAGVDYVPDYELVDDGPTPEQLLRGKKNQMLGLVSQMEQAASEAAMPHAKRRHHHYQTQDILAKDKDSRAPDEVEHLKCASALDERQDQIARHAAMLHHQIEDLTVENFDTWELKEFPR